MPQNQKKKMQNFWNILSWLVAESRLVGIRRNGGNSASSVAVFQQHQLWLVVNNPKLVLGVWPKLEDVRTKDMREDQEEHQLYLKGNCTAEVGNQNGSPEGADWACDIMGGKINCHFPHQGVISALQIAESQGKLLNLHDSTFRSETAHAVRQIIF